jgi:hypothetical protein
MTKMYVNAMAGLLVAMVAVPVFADRAQDELEENLSVGFGESDVITDTTPPKPYVPFRYRNSLPRFQWLLDKYGWTTNQLIDGLICVITNNVVEENWSVRRKERAARMAAKQLSEIPLPVVTNFFRQFNDKDDTSKLKGITLPAMLYRTNLEPEVMAYMRSLCVRTNVSCNVGFDVVYIMFETLKTMPDEMKPAATNRVAKYMYFAIHNETDTQGWHDRELARFIPAYSNSFQRLSLMRYVAGSTTNVYQRKHAVSVVQRLESLPTNQLNNISWIAEDVTGGK